MPAQVFSFRDEALSRKPQAQGQESAIAARFINAALLAVGSSKARRAPKGAHSQTMLWRYTYPLLGSDYVLIYICREIGISLFEYFGTNCDVS